MSDMEKRIMETFEKVVPQLSELGKEKLLIFGEGVALMAEQQRTGNPTQATAQDSA